MCVGSFTDAADPPAPGGPRSRLCTSLGPGGVSQLRYGADVADDGRTAQVPVGPGGGVVTTGVRRRRPPVGLQVHVWTIDDPAEIDGSSTSASTAS